MNRTLLALLLALLVAMAVVRADDPAAASEGEADAAAKTDEPKADEPPADETKPDEGAEEVDEAEERLKPSPDVTTFIHFPEFADRKLPIGGEVHALIGIHNSGKSAFNVSYIGASLHSPFQLDYYIQNFSVRVYSSIIGPGAEQTFDYMFKPDARLEPLEFWLSGWVIFNNSETGQIFQNYWTNSTLELVERPSDLNARRVFTYFLAFAAAAMISYLAYHLTASPSKKSQTERGTRDSSSSSSSGFEAVAYSPAAASKPIRRKSGATPKATKKPAAAATAAPAS